MFFLLLHRTLLWALTMLAVWQDLGQICGRFIYVHLQKKDIRLSEQIKSLKWKDVEGE